MLEIKAVLAVVAAARSVQATTPWLVKPHARGGKIYADLLEQESAAWAALPSHGERATNSTPNTFDAWIDPSDGSKGTFKLRWWQYNKNWDGTGPIFLIINGCGAGSID